MAPCAPLCALRTPVPLRTNEEQPRVPEDWRTPHVLRRSGLEEESDLKCRSRRVP